MLTSMNITSSMTGASYERMSMDVRQLGDGVERQHETNVEMAAKDGVPLVAKFEDNDISAYDPSKIRPDFEKVLHAMERHEFDVLYLWHTDRLYRQMDDAVRLLNAARKGGVILRPAKGSTIDPSKAGDEMVAYILAAVGGYESRHHAERRIAANTQRAERGEWSTANRPFGYNMDGTSREPEAQAFRDAVTDILSGKSIRGVAREWNAAKLYTTRGNEWNGATVRNVIVNPRYAAILTHRGETYQGKWQHLIEPETHHALVNYVSNPARTNGRVSWDQVWIGSGLYYCGVCNDGTRLRSAGSRPVGYMCRNAKHLHIGQERLDKYVVGAILEWFAREDCRDLVHTPEDMQKLVEELEGIDGEIAILGKAKVGVDISASVLLAANTDLLARRRVIEQKLSAATGLSTSPANTLIDGSRRAHLASEDAGNAVRDLWAAMTVTQQAQAIDEVATVTILPAQTLGPLRGRLDTDRIRVVRRQPES